MVDKQSIDLLLYDTMELMITKKSPLSIREQIKRQVRLLIENQELLPGQALSSARDLSAILGVNRNTITHAYKELETEGILQITTGSGTYVKDGLVLKSKRKLNQVFDRAVQHALDIGFSPDEIVEHFISRLSSLTLETPGRQVLVVDCNDEVIQYLCEKISKETGAQTTGVLIQELEQDPDQALSFFENIDLVVCGFNHLEELKRAVPRIRVDVVAVPLRVDGKVINTLLEQPKNTKTGFVCANQRSTETLYNSVYFSKGRELRRILAGYDNSSQLQRLLDECRVIFVTEFIYPRLKPMVRPGQKLVRVDISVDSGSMALIKEKLGK